MNLFEKIKNEINISKANMGKIQKDLKDFLKQIDTEQFIVFKTVDGYGHKNGFRVIKAVPNFEFRGDDVFVIIERMMLIKIKDIIYLGEDYREGLSLCDKISLEEIFEER